MPLTTRLANARISQKPDGLTAIHDSSINIAIYQRDISSLKPELDQISQIPVNFMTTGTVEEIRTELAAYSRDHLPACPAFLADADRLTRLFQQVSKSDSLKLQLSTVTTNMCRRFHTDMNDLRMLCTYVGAGTLWLPDDAINAAALKPGTSNDEIVLDERLIQQVATGDVTILKGALYPEANAILHRSPTIEETGEHRLLLRIGTNKSALFDA